MRAYTQIELWQLARQNRSWLTESEARLWSALRRRQLGVQFRRQVPLARRFIVDFLAPSVALIVEVDGASHVRRVAADARRDEALCALGFRTLRLEAEMVIRDLPRAVERVRAAL